MSRRELKRALQRAAPEDPAARERALRVVQSAYKEYEPRARRRPWAVLLATAVLMAAGAVGAAAASAPKSDVGRLVRDLLGVGEPRPRPVLVQVPGGGRLLVESGAGAWVVSDSGAKRRLGDYEGASLSPRGLFAVVWRGRELMAIDPKGRVRWSLPRPQPIAVARWAPGDGFRIAYLSGGALRIVYGDGTRDRRYGAVRAEIAPAWRPRARHELAYVDARGRLTVAAVDARRRLWRGATVGRAAELLWSSAGDRLLVLMPGRLLLYDGAGRLRSSRALPAGLSAQHAVWAPRGARVAVVRRDRASNRSDVVVLNAAGGTERFLFGRPGRFGPPAWAPDASRLLLPLPDADQWLFLRPDGSGRLIAVSNIARQFTPGADPPAFPRSVQWCCAP